MERKHSDGFTLIELSIVLVIIGLIVGGVLVGRDLIQAAQLRAQISQIEKFRTAANTFRVKYGYLPGDIPDPTASGCGFAPRGTFGGEGDGDGLLQGIFSPPTAVPNPTGQGGGETAMFWVDLSAAGLINGNFNTAVATTDPGSSVTGGAIGNYLPTSKLGRTNYVYVFAFPMIIGGISAVPGMPYANYFGISAASQITPGGAYIGSAGMTVLEAYNIDFKVDDGLPQSGTVRAVVVTGGPLWSAGSGVGANPGTAAAGSATTCYDNNNNAAQPMTYSVGQNGGSNINCTLSFPFQ